MASSAPLDFTLTCDQVPDFPSSTLWADQLRWAICVCDPDETIRLKFLAGCLAYAIENDGLTKAQATAASDIIRKIRKAWAEGSLLCQLTPPDEGPDTGIDLAAVEPEGRA